MLLVTMATCMLLRDSAAACAGRRRFRITRLPRFLVLHVKRFLRNQFFVEKNPTIVNFPVKNLDLAACIPVPKGLGNRLAHLSRGCLAIAACLQGSSSDAAPRCPQPKSECQLLFASEDVWGVIRSCGMHSCARQQHALVPPWCQPVVGVAAGKDGSPLPAKYDLVANLVHEGKAGEGVYKEHIHRKVEDIWYEVQVRLPGG